MSSTTLVNRAVAEQRQAAAREHTQSTQQLINVGSNERTISLVAGAVLLGLGLSRGGLATLGLGGALIYRGASGYCSVYHALGVDSSGK